jgi:dipeptidyl aminopeptidase/acylaminoacyl peptidase
LPALANLVLSPDGQRFAALLNEPDRTVLVSQRITGDAAAQPVLQTDNAEFQFRWARWVNNGRLLVGVRFAARRGFVRTVETRLLSVRADGTGVVNLVSNQPLAGTMSGTVRAQQLQDQVLDWLPEDGQHVLLALVDPNYGGSPGVYKVDVETGERRLVRAPERNVFTWVTDVQHRVRVAVREVDGLYEVRALEPGGSEWRTLWSYRAGGDVVWPLGFGLDPQELYVRADHEGREAIFSVRLDQPDLPRTLRLAHPLHDVQGALLRAPANGEVVGLRNGGTDDENGQSRSELWSPPWRALAKSIDAALPERDNRLIAMSRDEQRYLVYSSGNGQPGEYFFGNRAANEMSFMANAYPALTGVKLAGKRRATIKARDGLNLDAWLTRPVGSGNAPLPLVLLPHGGPASRDDDDFDSWAELLANRGYTVLQVNFRGSDGYGRQFKEAGLQRWGLEMQDDLTDAVQWAIAQRIADPKRICIVGGSYGGYAALMGLVKTPELYRCAVSFAGVTDLPDLIAFERDYRGGDEAAERQFGSAWRDRDRLRSTSPARQAERVQAPVLLVHGDADRVVPVEQSRDMAKALRRAGKPVRYIEQEGGDHQLSRNTQRVEFFKAMEAFLDEQLKPTAAN